MDNTNFGDRRATIVGAPSWAALLAFGLFASVLYYGAVLWLLTWLWAVMPWWSDH